MAFSCNKSCLEVSLDQIVKETVKILGSSLLAYSWCVGTGARADCLEQFLLFFSFVGEGGILVPFF